MASSTDAPQTTATRLNELEADEMFDVGRAINSALTREVFDADWAEFCEMKRRRATQ